MQELRHRAGFVMIGRIGIRGREVTRAMREQRVKIAIDN